MAACNGMDTAAAFALVDPAFEMVETPALPGAATTTGLHALERYFAGWRRNWSEWSWVEEELLDMPPDKVLVMARLKLKGLRSGLWVEHVWAYVFTVGDGKLLRQDGFNTKAEAVEAAAVR
jgi:hypothetical protein